MSRNPFLPLPLPDRSPKCPRDIIFTVKYESVDFMSHDSPQLIANHYRAHIALHGGHNEMIKNPAGAGIKDDNTRWPGYPGKGEIAYTIDKSLEQFQELIEEAMDQYHKYTCIRFVKRTK
ncbi:hypothetical protein AVEN_81408-1 [Araneus ventricosus]|uniref:Peptidase M12A domain-containing protein n=1 Tax=Araneus ventricosus TaxID=182803 RepID=A0A4Y2MP30_ARAVE|nr:hypothetical protein AVEN_81408-1 [Araneus ventricosus]